MAVPHPLPYQGSKRHLAQSILAYFPSDATRLIEPFAGSAAISLAALYCGTVSRALISDSDTALMRLWEEIVCYPERLSAAYQRLWEAQIGQERQYYDMIRQQFNQTHQPEDFLYLLARCVKAAVRYNERGNFNQSSDNRRKGARPAEMSRRIQETAKLLKGRIEIRSGDYQTILQEATALDIVYLDPPYQGVCKRRDPRYREKVLLDDFIDALETLNQRSIAYLVSYDGRTGNKTYGQLLPEALNLVRLELAAGRSSQATLLGKTQETYESLYISPALLPRLEARNLPQQLALF
jgi:DNA adenine methylase